VEDQEKYIKSHKTTTFLKMVAFEYNNNVHKV
jgi:hypothetical protein